MIIPNQIHNMHSAPELDGDTWLHDNLDTYYQWAKTHNSVLIVTWDEDDDGGLNQIDTVFAGQPVVHGDYAEGSGINHYSVLRTLEDMFSVGYAGSAASATSITDIWATPEPGSIAVLGLAAMGLLLRRRARYRSRA